MIILSDTVKFSMSVHKVNPSEPFFKRKYLEISTMMFSFLAQLTEHFPIQHFAYHMELNSIIHS